MSNALTQITNKTKQVWRRVSAAFLPSKSKQPQQKESEQAFRKSQEFLLAPPLWTYGAMRHYQEQMLELVGANKLQSKVTGEGEMAKKLRKNIRMLEAMDAYELASNHKDVFTKLSQQLIAEKANVEVKDIENLIQEHDMLRADRRWYKIRMQFKRPLPRTADEREVMATRDRPLSETEKTLLKGEHLKQVHKFMEMKKMTQPPPVGGLFFRHPSKGFDRWRVAPPRREPRFQKPKVARVNRL
jgi:hypothetical protein